MLSSSGILRPGTDSTKSRAEQAAAAAERRKTYPAGRVLHLVPSRFVFAEAAQSGSAAVLSGAAAGTAAAHSEGSRDEMAENRQHWGRSERSWTEDGSSDVSSDDDEDEDDLWEEMDTPGSLPAASPGQPLSWHSEDREPAGASGSPSGTGGLANELLSPPDAATLVEAGTDASATDPTAAAVAIVGVRANHKHCLPSKPRLTPFHADLVDRCNFNCRLRGMLRAATSAP